MCRRRILHANRVSLGHLNRLKAACCSKIQQLVPERWRGTMSSALTMAYGISIAGVSLGGGWMIDALGYRTLFLSSAVITATGVLYFQGYFRIPRGEYSKRLTDERA